MASLSPLMSELLDQGSFVEITVTGKSMRPMLLDRISCVRLASVGELRRGDVLLYVRDNGTFVLHRVVSMETERFACCGDAQWCLEPGLRRNQVIGVVTHFARKGKKWTTCNNTLYGLYWRIWLAVRPLRRLVLGGIRRLKAVGRK